MVTAREVQEFLSERPDLEPAVAAILEPDAPWSFDDVDVDSGEFGELVSRGIVEDVEDGYRVVNADAVSRGLDGTIEDSSAESGWTDRITLPEVNRVEFAALAGALLLVVLLRMTSFPTVFRGDAIVLSSNDPYYYRYWLEQLLTDPETTFTPLPASVRSGEPLMIAVLWSVITTLGGTVEVAGAVLAWYPVVSAIATAILVYAIAVLVTNDRRIGIASVLMLAVLPGHAFRTSVGFADHHAFDYPFLIATLLGIVLVATWNHSNVNHSWRAIAGTVAITFGVSGQVLAWSAGPLLIVPVGLVVAILALVSVSDGRSPIQIVGPIVLASVLAAGITWFVHTTYAWHTTLVASSPILLAIGCVGILFVNELWYRLDLPVNALAAVEVVGALMGAYVFRILRPELWTRMQTEVTERLLAPRDIAEFQSLFGDSVGWLLLFGFLLFLALPYMVWGTNQAGQDARWLAPVVYGWYFLILAGISIRFAGQLSPLVAIFAGFGFVHLAEWIDVARRPTPLSGDRVDEFQLPDRRQAFTLVGLFLLVTGLSIVQVPVKTSQISSSNNGYEAAAWMADYSDEHDMKYPENYVFSQWGHNRMYNYFVSGESRSYGFAQSNYEPFVVGTNASQWYERLRGRVGFVVTTNDVVTNESTIGTRLHSHNGSRSESAPGLAHYRLVHVEEEGAYKVFTLVEGAVISGEAEPNSRVTLQTTVELDSYSFEYARQVTADDNGTYSIRVAYPGTYEFGDTSVTVPDNAVQNGTTVRIERKWKTNTSTAASRSLKPSIDGTSLLKQCTVDKFAVERSLSIQTGDRVDVSIFGLLSHLIR